MKENQLSDSIELKNTYVLSSQALRFEEEEIELSISERFEKVVQRYPKRLAAISHENQLTYAELHQLSHCLAKHILQIQGDRKEPVALLLGHDIWMVVGIIAVLKAGKVYVALDPNNPLSRVNDILLNASPYLIITQPEYLELSSYINAPETQVLELFSCLEKRTTPSQDSNTPPKTLIKASAENIAAIFYTSGSTGTPKGVQRNHLHILQRVWLEKKLFAITENDKFLLIYSFGFGASCGVIFNALLNGGTLCIYDFNLKGISQLKPWILEQKITFFYSPGSLFQEFIELLRFNDFFPKVRQVLPSGKLYKIVWQKAIPFFQEHCVFIQRFASSETGLCTINFLYSDVQVEGDVIPVGFPVEGKEILLVNEKGQDVGINGVGEIVVKSPYMSPGYWNNSELTKQKFLPAPDGNRLYYTGDLGRRRADGCLELVGRKDFMVKIRGYRVEPSESEAAIVKVDAVRQVVVVGREDSCREKQLVAYVVLSETQSISAGQLRQILRKGLPDYLIPSRFVFLDKLPLTHSGKIDRSALPEPNWTTRNIETPLIPPKTSSERLLYKIWCQVLQITEIGINDNFFELGGHSLLATKVLSRLSAEHNIYFPLSLIFEKPTIADLAKIIDHPQLDSEQYILPPLEPRTQKQSLPLSLGQQRLWFLEQLEEQSTTYNLTTAIQLDGPLNIAALEQTVSEIIRRHESLRTTFPSIDGTPQQVIAPPYTITLPIADLSSLSETERISKLEKQIKDLTARVFDLSQDRLFQLTLVRMAQNSHVLLLSRHHLVSDRWSSGQLYSEIRVIYEAFSKGKCSPLEELSIQYADFALWQRQWLKGDMLAQQIQYWKQELLDIPPRLKLPTDRLHPPAQTFNGAVHKFQLDESLVSQLKILSQQSQVTLFMLLLSAYSTLLAQYSGQEDIIIGSPIANRRHYATEPLIGFFLNILVLRVRFHEDPSFRDLLTQVRRTVLNAYEYQDIPFEKLVAQLNPPRDRRYSPWFQVMFILQNSPMNQLTLPNLNIHFLEIPRTTAKFELTLVIQEINQKLEAEIEYNVDLFEKESIVRFSQQFSQLLEKIVANPNSPALELLLTENAFNQCLEDTRFYTSNSSDFDDADVQEILIELEALNTRSPEGKERPQSDCISLLTDDSDIGEDSLS